jgi:broad specificity phosphatase PhoE
VGAEGLWLVRHGETEWSAEGRHTGLNRLPLTEQWEDAGGRALGRPWRGRSLRRCYAARCGRARETCEIAGFGDVAVVDEGLHEWDYGVYEGRTSQEIQAEIPDWSVWKDPIVGGETVEQVGARADGVIARALARGVGDPQTDDVVRVALFAHAHILRILAARWVGLVPRDGSLFVLGTGSVSVLGWEKETRVIQRWNRGFEERSKVDMLQFLLAAAQLSINGVNQ